MSGGHFDYNQYRISDIATQIEDLIEYNGKENERLYTYEYSPEVIAKFQKAVKILEIAAHAAHHIDWLVCGDTAEESFTERWNRDVEPKLKELN